MARAREVALGLVSTLCIRLLNSCLRVNDAKKKLSLAMLTLNKSYVIFDIGIRLQCSHTEANNQNRVLLGSVFQVPGIYKGLYTAVAKQQ